MNASELPAIPQDRDIRNNEDTASRLRRTVSPATCLDGDVDEGYVEAVLDLVEQIPSGRATTYGSLAAVVGGGPRQIGSVMARYGAPVPWWRVVRADGTLPPSHGERARDAYLVEGTPLKASGALDLSRAYWDPETKD